MGFLASKLTWPPVRLCTQYSAVAGVDLQPRLDEVQRVGDLRGSVSVVEPATSHAAMARRSARRR